MPKFRAWDTTKKEMFKDTFAITESGQVVVVEQDFITNAPDYIFVDHLTIMQSTGLCDKNGQEIFDGDILKHHTHKEYTFIVKYDKEYGRWIGDGINCIYNIDISKDFVPYYEIIGNIYQNKDLLKEN